MTTPRLPVCPVGGMSAHLIMTAYPLVGMPAGSPSPRSDVSPGATAVASIDDFGYPLLVDRYCSIEDARQDVVFQAQTAPTHTGAAGVTD